MMRFFLKNHMRPGFLPWNQRVAANARFRIAGRRNKILARAQSHPEKSKADSLTDGISPQPILGQKTSLKGCRCFPEKQTRALPSNAFRR
jgi:hypothetical protein